MTAGIFSETSTDATSPDMTSADKASFGTARHQATAEVSPRALFFHLLVFVGSFLLFQVELIVGRLLLPLYGNSASVWTTCLMYYQGLLFLGYLYADRVAARIREGRYRWAHLGLLLIPVMSFPLHVWRLELAPIPAIVLALTVAVGLPFFAISTTSVVAQAWFTRTSHPRGRDPYFLYGSSNVGALVALVTYPFLVEPSFAVSTQLAIWYAGYAVFFVLHVFCVRQVRKKGSGGGNLEVPDASFGESSNEVHVAASGALLVGSGAKEVSIGSRLQWLLMAAGANALLMAVTQEITMDAPVPLLWVLPLTLYLLTLILCFGRRLPSQRIISAIKTVCLVFGVAALLSMIARNHLQQSFIVLHSMLLVIGCLLCHYALVRSKPTDTRWLGTFYLHISLGGWLGAVVVSVVMPIAFSWLAVSAVDYLAAGGLILAGFLTRDRALVAGFFRQHRGRAAAILLLLVVAGVAGSGGIRTLQTGDVHGSRTFYGVYRVRDQGGFRWFHHGNTIHGIQSLSDPDGTLPLSYFFRESPVGQVLDSELELGSIGVVGLGAGTMVAYERPGQTWDFYEIDPEVQTIARDHFTFLDHARAPTRVVLGDARLTLEKATDAGYNLLILDCFASDFVPLHMVTREAVDLYLKKTKPDGLVLFHISSRLFDVTPVLVRIASEQGLMWAQTGVRGADQRSLEAGKLPSMWFVMTRDPNRYRFVKETLGWKSWMISPEVASRRVWTDDYVNIFDAL